MFINLLLFLFYYYHLFVQKRSCYLEEFYILLLLLSVIISIIIIIIIINEQDPDTWRTALYCIITIDYYYYSERGPGTCRKVFYSIIISVMIIFLNGVLRSVGRPGIQWPSLFLLLLLRDSQRRWTCRKSHQQVSLSP